jgi:vacuolar-type H+-ATPase subunit H
MLNEDFDPLKELEELKKFATAADKHIAQLHKNQGQILIAVNQLAQTIEEQAQRITELTNTLVETKNETTRKKR